MVDSMCDSIPEDHWLFNGTTAEVDRLDPISKHNVLLLLTTAKPHSLILFHMGT